MLLHPVPLWYRVPYVRYRALYFIHDYSLYAVAGCTVYGTLGCSDLTASNDAVTYTRVTRQGHKAVKPLGGAASSTAVNPPMTVYKYMDEL